MNIQQMITRFSFCLLAWCTLAVAPTCAQTITHVPLFTFDGDSAFDILGWSVSGAGDVNGDGFDDLIVGAPFDDNNGIDSGSVRVFSGVDGSVLHNFDGDGPEDGFGTASGAGDVNGDGFADLIVGTAGDDNNGQSSGSARVFSGADGSVLYNFDGDIDLDLLGASVSGAGDVNGDGFGDLLVGAPGDDNNFFSSGSARVFSGFDGSVLYKFEGDSYQEALGGSVSGVGDVNGDGVADLIVGAQYDDDNGTPSGSAQVFSGADGSVLYNFDGDSIYDRFGGSVSGAGDVNGDGFADLIVGAPSDDNNGDNSGSAQVFSGVDGSVLFNFDGDSASHGFGGSVSDAGDVNGDGFADLIVGARNDSTNGRGSGIARVFSGANGSVLYNFYGDAVDDQFGLSVSGAGDVNGDGVADFIVGAFGGGANNGGYARLFVSQIVFLQVNGAGPSDPDLFNTVINVPTDPDMGDDASVGGDGATTQLNVSDGGTVGTHFDAETGSEINISGGSIGDFLDARSGSEVNISGGSIGDGFRAFSNSFVNISGGTAGDAFHAFNGSEINLFGSDFVLDGVSLDDSLTIDDAFTILDRDVILTGLLTDGSPFSFELNSVFDSGVAQDLFLPNATLTVTLVAPTIILGDCNLDGEVSFLDINPFIAVLSSNSFLEQADSNQDGIVDFLDISPFIAILSGS